MISLSGCLGEERIRRGSLITACYIICAIFCDLEKGCHLLDAKKNVFYTKNVDGANMYKRKKERPLRVVMGKQVKSGQ